MDALVDEFTPRLTRLSTLYSSRDYHRQQDLFQEGAIGLMEAAKRFDHRKGAKLSTFANYHIRGRMQQFLRTEARHSSCLSLNDHSWRMELEEDDDFIPLTTAQSLSEIDSFLFEVEIRLIRAPVLFLQEGFTARQRSFMRLRYQEGLLPSEIAKLLRVSPARVCQVLTEAVSKLREAFLTV